MIATNNFLFIHTPKCAGMSLSDWLISNLKGEIFYFVPKDHFKSQQKSNVIVKEGIRHENLNQARERLKEININIETIEFILSIIRNPYELEISRYNYFKLGFKWDKGLAQDIAMKYNFKYFAKFAPFMGRSVIDFHIEYFYELDGIIPENMHIIKFEELNMIPELLKNYIFSVKSLPKHNVTSIKKYDLSKYYDKESELSIYYKYRWIFENGYYDRLKF